MVQFPTNGERFSPTGNTVVVKAGFPCVYRIRVRHSSGIPSSRAENKSQCLAVVLRGTLLSMKTFKDFKRDFESSNIAITRMFDMLSRPCVWQVLNWRCKEVHRYVLRCVVKARELIVTSLKPGMIPA
jgi:hypothetical protein